MRLCIHIDMDCFYAAIEERENPELKGKPVAVGGASKRGVICAANYEARKYGCRSAMPGFKALQLCPQLIMLPVRFDLYRAESARIRAIMGRFTDKIEPLSLDEAYLDLSHWTTEGSAIAREIRAQICEETGLAASAGIGSNKMLAKIASDWNKPNGQFEITPDQVDEFMRELPVTKLWGVGKKMRGKLEKIAVKTCGDLQNFSKLELTNRFGKWGLELYELCRGHDTRAVTTDRVRKSISKERTFAEDIYSPEGLRGVLGILQDEIEQTLLGKYRNRKIKSLVVKLKFVDFTRTTAERASVIQDRSVYEELLNEAWSRGEGKAVRLFGLGVKLQEEKDTAQLELF
ncbi:MAG: DNA polymerase IV [Akkermansiaceae bacterium]